MKLTKKIFAMVMVLAIVAAMLIIPSSAKKIDDYQNSVVCIGAEIKFTASNFDFSFTSSSTGTGFAVGKPGKPVQYIATCAHCVSEPAGVYTILIDVNTGAIVGKVEEEEGTEYPVRQTVDYSGTEYLIVRDYFNTEASDLYAIFSESSHDYVGITVAQINNDVDLAICKLASKPTDKIEALPLQLKADVEVNDDVIAIGYPSTSDRFNAEGRLDSSDSTVKDGIVSKKQRTSGTNGSKTTYDAYEVTAELITGMSGGPVISEETGAVIGVNAFITVDSDQAAAARYAVCIDYLTAMLDSESIDYKVAGSVNFLLIGGIGAGALVFIAILVILIVVLARKKPAPVPAPMPVYAAPQAGGPAPVNNVPAGAPAAASATRGISGGGKYYMYGIAGPLTGKKYGITSTAVIGRDSSKCNVAFPVGQAGVSSVHCEVRVSDGLLTLRDCGSSYGTFLENGNKLEPNIPVVIPTGTKFYLGSENIGFEVKY